MRDEIESLAHGLPQKDSILNNTNSTGSLKHFSSFIKAENEVTQKTNNLELSERFDNKTNNKLNSENPIINEHVETLHQKISKFHWITI